MRLPNLRFYYINCFFFQLWYKCAWYLPTYFTVCLMIANLFMQICSFKFYLVLCEELILIDHGKCTGVYIYNLKLSIKFGHGKCLVRENSGNLDVCLLWQLEHSSHSSVYKQTMVVKCPSKYMVSGTFCLGSYCLSLAST